jgi:peptide/nickel transport system permease protein
MSITPGIEPSPTTEAIAADRETRREDAQRIEGRTPFQLAWARLRKDRVAMISLGIIVLLILMAVFAPVIVKLNGHGPYTQFRETGLTPAGIPVGPNSNFWFGTDEVGRDIFSRVVYGARISLLVGVVATAVSVLIGVVIGTVAGYYGGKIDTVLSRFIDIVLGFPFLITAIALVSVFSPSVTIIIGVLVFFGWTTIARIARGQVLSVKEKEYMEAARSLGAGDVRIMVIDVLPNLIAPIIVYSTLLIPTNIVGEATLSFLGLGVIPPASSWGQMLGNATNGGLYQVAWWYVLFPGLALLLTTLAFNLFGDGLRDALDPGSDRAMAK